MWASIRERHTHEIFGKCHPSTQLTLNDNWISNERSRTRWFEKKENTWPIPKSFQGNFFPFVGGVTRKMCLKSSTSDSERNFQFVLREVETDLIDWRSFELHFLSNCLHWIPRRFFVSALSRWPGNITRLSSFIDSFRIPTATFEGIMFCSPCSKIKARK